MSGWQKVDGRVRCSECGALVVASWRWFAKPGTWTLALCLACVEKNTGGR